MRTRHSFLVLPALVAAIGLSACGDDGDDTSATPAATTGAPAASVSFAEPADGVTTTDTVTAKVDIEGFDLDAEAVGGAAVEGQGHLHFSLDEGKYDYPKYSGANGELAKKLGVEGKYSPSVEPAITYSGLPAGEHTLEVYLANNDHTDTGVSAETMFTVR